MAQLRADDAKPPLYFWPNVAVVPPPVNGFLSSSHDLRMALAESSRPVLSRHFDSVTCTGAGRDAVSFVQKYSCQWAQYFDAERKRVL